MPFKQGSILKSPVSFFTKFSTGKALLLTLTPFITVIVDSQMALIGLGIIITVDLLTGMLKSLYAKSIKVNPLKANFWKCITSKGLRETWRKGYEYGVGIIVVLALEVFFFPGSTIDILDKNFSITQLGIVIASVIEIWSIFENIEVITKRNPIKSFASIISNIKKIWK